MAKYAILSDIHGNLQALQEVYEDLKTFPIKGILLLGDLIDYGMQSNEVIQFIQKKLHYEIVGNIWGNHERAIMTWDFTGFSSSRGVNCAKRTASVLSLESRQYLNQELIHQGFCIIELNGMNCLVVHGSLDDYYWRAIQPENVCGNYEEYDIVFSGHSHYSHMFTKFYAVDNPEMRNKHAVLFINPGSVGQPRNHHAEAQYAIFDSDTKAVDMRSVKYDIKKTMSMFGTDVDVFYRDRLKNGI